MFFDVVILQRNFFLKKMMKTLLLMAAMIAVSGAMTQASAQISKKFKSAEDGGHHMPLPQKNIRPGRQMPVRVSYDSSTTLLTVDFPQNSEKSTVEVYRDGVKVTGITAGGGTTFSCTLKDYGEGEYDIIVSKGNTVVYSKNVSVR